MKLIILLMALLSSSLAFGNSQKEADMQKQIDALKSQLAAMEKVQNKNKSGGLKVKDMNNQKIDNSRSPASSGESAPQLSPAQMKQLQDSLKKGQEYLEERNQYLEELMNE